MKKSRIIKEDGDGNNDHVCSKVKLLFHIQLFDFGC